MNSSEKSIQLQKPRNIKGVRSGIIESKYNADWPMKQIDEYIDG